MLWRFPASIRSLITSHYPRYTSTKTSAPLKILFCGSDHFSIASLRALDKAKRDDPRLIASIEVAHRPGKPTGRGLKVIREVPIKQVATEELRLKTHEIDTFTGWTSPNPIDLVIAVSFGLFVPPRILNGATYGGLNVHPSLLPDLHGPAPIHHTLLKRRSRTGITIQTLHSKHFDRGTILAQTPPPGLDVPQNGHLGAFTDSLGKIGGEMLVELLQARAFVPPLQDVGWYGQSSGPVEHARKINKQDGYLNFSVLTAENILLKDRVLGFTWCMLPHLPESERVNFLKIAELSDQVIKADRKPGLFVNEDFGNEICIQTKDGRILHVISCMLSGRKTTGQAKAQLRRILA